jgi:hypothetical protein
MIVATAVGIAAMTVATDAMTARTAVAALGCCADSSMGGPTTRPLVRWLLRHSTRAVHGSVTR